MKIEEGCLSVIVNSTVTENIGKSVTVMKFVGDVFGFTGSDRWLIDGVVVGNRGSKVNHQREAYLMRIDGIKESIAERETATA